jgi:ectoine hydroxylase-related dioxygenase (phytanoyl-CoA dioxygenase family)
MEAVITQAQLEQYQADGYLVIKGLFSAQEAAYYRDRYMDFRVKGTYPGDEMGVALDTNPDADPLKRFPRMIHMHHWDKVAFDWLLEARINAALTALLGKEPYAVQTMLYFKPPGARGQALHQDNYYLRAQPGTCIAAWMALDTCDIANGCMQVVPGSQNWPILCTTKADTTQSFTDVTVPIPEGQEVRPVFMEPGDVLFFNGSLVHGSFPNTSGDRFRRALIAHYIEGDATQIAKWYSPIYRMDGTIITLDPSDLGGRCGTWVDTEGKPAIVLTGLDAVTDYAPH